MNERERFLSILVAGLLIGGGVWWGLGKYQTALKKRTAAIANKTTQRDAGFDVQLQGAMADRQMGLYVERSLPSNSNLASRQYAGWMLEAAGRHGLKDVAVDPQSTQTRDGLYQQLTFQVQGNTSVKSWVDWMHEFYAKDYLHRIRTWSLRPNRAGGFRLDMTIDAVAILGRADDIPVPEGPSYRIAGDVTEYRDTILNRNLFEPPNKAPRFTGKSTVDVIEGKPTTTPLTFEDSEQQPLKFELVDAPESPVVRLDERSGNLRIEDATEGEFEIQVRVTDNGYPPRSTDQTLAVRVRPPEMAPKPVVKLKFDDAKQTVLTALVQGKERFAWLNVKTRGKTLKLRVGDSFEVGSVSGKVVNLSSRDATIEVDGKQFAMKLKDNLKAVVGDPDPETTGDAEDSADPNDAAAVDQGPADRAEADPATAEVDRNARNGSPLATLPATAE